MNLQFNFPDTLTVHTRENNAESEQHLYKHKKHFEGKCKKLYDLLISGHRLTVYSALVEHGIASLPRRFLDLTESGVMATSETMTGTRIKEYYCTPEQIQYNLNLITQTNK